MTSYSLFASIACLFFLIEEAIQSKYITKMPKRIDIVAATCRFAAICAIAIGTIVGIYTRD